MGAIKLLWGWFVQQAPLCPCSCFWGLPTKPGSKQQNPVALLPHYPLLEVPAPRSRGCPFTSAGFDTSPVPSWGCQVVALEPEPHIS